MFRARNSVGDGIVDAGAASVRCQSGFSSNVAGRAALCPVQVQVQVQVQVRMRMRVWQTYRAASLRGSRLRTQRPLRSTPPRSSCRAALGHASGRTPRPQLVGSAWRVERRWCGSAALSIRNATSDGNAKGVRQYGRSRNQARGKVIDCSLRASVSPWYMCRIGSRNIGLEGRRGQSRGRGAPLTRGTALRHDCIHLSL